MDVKLIRLAFHLYLLSLAVCQSPRSGIGQAAVSLMSFRSRGPRADRQKSTRLGHSSARGNGQLGQGEKNSQRAYVFRIDPDSCRKRAVPALTFSARTGHKIAHG